MPHPQIKIVGETSDGTIKAIAVSNDGSLVTSGGMGSGGGGDASAANQLEEINHLSFIREVLTQAIITIESSPPAIFDYSGTIVTPLESFAISNGYVSPLTAHLFLQNLDIDGGTNGNLWLNFNNLATAGAGSILIKPGESLELSKGSFLFSQLYLLGEAQSSYTLKIASFDQS